MDFKNALKNALRGTRLESPARKLRDLLLNSPSVHGPLGPERTPAQLRILACATHATSTPKQQSVLFFTTHKCASTFAATILTKIGELGPRAHFDYDGTIWGLGNAVPFEDSFSVMSTEGRHLFFPEGEVYGPIRKPINIENPNAYRMIFFLRDPRDVLVSAFYSFGFSHGLPKHSERLRTFLEQRKQIQTEGIDRYVLRAASEWLVPIYRDYEILRQRAGSNLYIQYEDYSTNPKDTIQRIFEFCGTDDTTTVNALAAAATPISVYRDGNTELRHKRSGRSGQFKTELDAVTCGCLDSILSETLTTWGFPK